MGPVVRRCHFQEARALMSFVFDHEVAAQVAGTWAYFFRVEGK